MLLHMSSKDIRQSRSVVMLRNNFFYTKTENAAGESQKHLQPNLIGMDGVYGGTAFLPHAQFNAFRDCLADDLENDRMLFFSERPTTSRVFNFFVDLDASRPADKPGISDDDLQRWGAAILEVVRGHYPDEPAAAFRTAIAAPAEPTPKKNGERLKRGAHYHFSRLRVTMEQFVRLTDAIARGMPEDTYADGEPWSVRIDPSVWRNGLRIVGCHKCTACPGCPRGGNDQKSCNECCGLGKSAIATGRSVYRVIQILQGDGTPIPTHELTIIQSNWRRAIDECSIVCAPSMAAAAAAGGGGAVEPTPGFRAVLPDPGDLPSIVRTHELLLEAHEGRLEFDPKKHDAVAERERMLKRCVGKKYADGTDIDTAAAFVGDIPTMLKHTKHEVMGGSAARVVQEIIRGAWPELYAGIEVRKVLRSGKEVLVHVHGPGSQRCQNANRNHSGNHIFFVIRREADAATIEQRCFSDKAPDKDLPVCSKFRSEPKMLTNPQSLQVFGIDVDTVAEGSAAGGSKKPNVIVGPHIYRLRQRLALGARGVDSPLAIDATTADPKWLSLLESLSRAADERLIRVWAKNGVYEERMKAGSPFAADARRSTRRLYERMLQINGIEER